MYFTTSCVQLNTSCFEFATTTTLASLVLLRLSPVHEVQEVQSSLRNAVAVAAVASAVQPAAVPEPVPVSRMTSRQVDKCHENSELHGNSSGSSYPSKILNLWCPDRGIWHFKMELKDHQDGIMY